MSERKTKALFVLGPLVWLLALASTLWGVETAVCLAGSVPNGECLGEGVYALRRMLLLAGGAAVAATVCLTIGKLVGVRTGRIRIPRILYAIALVGPAALGIDLIWSIPETSGNRPDVYLVIVDTLRADAITPERTPAMAELIEDGVAFPNAVSPSSWTLPAFGSMFTGRHPMEHGLGSGDGVRSRGPLADGIPTLASALGDAGYQTVAVTTNYYLAPGLDLFRGFQQARNLAGGATAFRAARGLAAPRLVYAEARLQVDRVRGVLRADLAEDRPVFLLIHFMDPHVPRNPAAGLVARERRASPSQSSRTTLYGAEVRVVDRALDSLFTELKSAGRYEDALVILVSDHGEELDEDRPEGGPHDHGHTLYPETVRVPLAIRLPGGLARGTVCGPVATTRDLPATVLSVLGLPPLSEDARPLLGEGGTCAPPRPHVFTGLMLYGPPRWGIQNEEGGVIWTPSSGRWEGYDSRADPAWVSPSSVPPPTLVEALREHVAAQAEAAPSPSDRNDEIDRDVDLLRSLGYVE